MKMLIVCLLVLMIGAISFFRWVSPYGLFMWREGQWEAVYLADSAPTDLSAVSIDGSIFGISSGRRNLMGEIAINWESNRALVENKIKELPPIDGLPASSIDDSGRWVVWVYDEVEWHMVFFPDNPNYFGYWDILFIGMKLENVGADM